jgi:hypothetical protein
MLHVVCFSSGCLRHCCPLDIVCVPFLRRMSHVLRCLFSGARPSVPCRVACLSLVPRRISSRRMCCVASRRLQVACCTSTVAYCILCVACPILHAVTPSRLLPARTAIRRITPSRLRSTRTHTSVCSRSRRPLRRSIASAAAGIRAPEASRRKARRTSHVFDH